MNEKPLINFDHLKQNPKEKKHRWRVFRPTWVTTVMPLIIWLLTAGYGLLNIDAFDEPGKTSYGVMYLILILPVVFISMIVSYLRNFIFCINNFRQKSENSAKRFLLYLYTGSLISAVILIIVNGFMILFSSELLKTTSGRMYVAFITLMAVSGFLLKKINFELKFVKNKITAFGLAIGIILTVCGGFYAIETYRNYKLSNMHTDVIGAYLKDHNISGEIKTLKVDEDGDNRIKVEYSITQEQSTIHAFAELEKKPKIHVKENSLTNYDKDANKLLLNEDLVQAAKPTWLEFRKTLKKAIKDTKLFSDLSIKDESDFPRDIRLLNVDKNPRVKKLAQANLRSKDKNLRTFGGYRNISFKDAMENHILLISADIEGTLIESDIAKLLNNLDCSKLPDGYYDLGVLIDGPYSYTTFEIKDHQIIRSFEYPPTALVEDTAQQLNIGGVLFRS